MIIAMDNEINLGHIVLHSGKAKKIPILSLTLKYDSSIMTTSSLYQLDALFSEGR